MKNKFIFSLSVILCILLQFNAKAQQLKTEVIILHCNDIHAAIDQFPKLATVVQDFRAKNKNVLLISDGDLFSGNPFVDKCEDRGFPIIDLMNYLKFDLSELGNHEFDYGQDILNQRIKQANFPFICSNVKNISGSLVDLKPYYNFRFLDSIDISFVGFLETENDGFPSSHPKNLKGLEFYNAMDYAQNFGYLKNNSECLIALNHLGIEVDTVFAKKYNIFDIIIGGHSHTVINNQLVVNNSVIAQTGSSLKNVGVIKLTFTDYKLSGIENYLINLQNYEVSDSAKYLNEIIAKYKENKYLNETAGNTETDIKDNDELGSFFTDAVRNYTKSDISFQNNGGLRVPVIAKGEIFNHQIYALDPFGNYVVTIEMTVPQIKKFIENSYKSKNKIELQVSGITYNITTNSENEFVDIELYDLKNKLIKDKKSFSVSMNTYIFESYKIDYQKIIKKYEVTSAEMILDFLKDKKSINYSGSKRAFLNK